MHRIRMSTLSDDAFAAVGSASFRATQHTRSRKSVGRCAELHVGMHRGVTSISRRFAAVKSSSSSALVRVV
jgi:hypothetical protein